nr:MAG TPA: hypothetical protein [Caudoviricetes sp.]
MSCPRLKIIKNLQGLFLWCGNSFFIYRKYF